jgi:T5orf172 domain
MKPGRRPRTGVASSDHITVRFDQDEASILRDGARAEGLSVSAFIRQRVLGRAEHVAPRCYDGAGVYAISDGNGLIKIGRSSNIAKRLAYLQTAHGRELRLLAVLSTVEDDEGKIQAQWAHIRVRGEWFRETPELSSYISRGAI